MKGSNNPDACGTDGRSDSKYSPRLRPVLYITICCLLVHCIFQIGTIWCRGQSYAGLVRGGCRGTIRPIDGMHCINCFDMRSPYCHPSTIVELHSYTPLLTLSRRGSCSMVCMICRYYNDTCNWMFQQPVMYMIRCKDYNIECGSDCVRKLYYKLLCVNR